MTTHRTNHDAEAQTTTRSVSNGVDNRHETVLLTEAVEALAIAQGDVVVDATVGGAGHFTRICEALSGNGTIVGIDADPEAIARGKAAAARFPGVMAHLVEGNFRDLDAILGAKGIDAPDAVLFDLGWSAYHLDSGKGFSFRADEPLLMTYGAPEAGHTAADLVNSLSEGELAELLNTLGEERFARPIARAIVAARREKRILMSGELAAIVESATPAWYRTRRIHPATKTFQALRMAVNDELGALRQGLSAALARVAPGGRIAVITFHSIEDRIVKELFRDMVREGKGALVTKKPVVPAFSEVRTNPRARSAKLRILERCGAARARVSAHPAFAYA